MADPKRPRMAGEYGGYAPAPGAAYAPPPAAPAYGGGYGAPVMGMGGPPMPVGGYGGGYGAVGGGGAYGAGGGGGGYGAGGYGAGGGGGGGFNDGFFPCVKLRGLPFNCYEDDVRMFLAAETVDVLMVKRGGRFSGEAYVVLSSPMQMDFAMQKNKMNMGRRYIEIFRAKRWDYYRAVASEVMEDHGPGGGYRGDQGPGGPPMEGGAEGEEGGPRGGIVSRGGPAGPPAEHTGVLKLRGLPFSATVDDLVRWFVDPSINLSAPVLAENVAMVYGYDGKSTGQAFVEFASPEDAKEAMIKDRQMLGTRYIELFPSSREDMTRATGHPGSSVVPPSQAPEPAAPPAVQHLY